MAKQELAVVQTAEQAIDALHEDNPFIPRTWAQAIEMGTFMSRASMVPDAYKQKPNDIVVAMMRGHELGLSPIQSLTYFDVIKGKVTMSAQMIIALCLRKRAICRYFICTKSTDTEATFKTLRVGAPEPVSLTFTIDDARKMDLAGKPNWKQQPKVMLRWRAATALARSVYSDLIVGLYDPEELDPDRQVDDEAVRSEMARDVTPEKEPPVTSPATNGRGVEAAKAKTWEAAMTTRLNVAKTTADFQAVYDEFKAKALPDDHPLRVYARARVAAVRAEAEAQKAAEPKEEAPSDAAERDDDLSPEELAEMKADLARPGDEAVLKEGK